MQRICMIVQSLYPNDERVRRQAVALGAEGVEVDVICMRGEGQAEAETFGSVTAHRVMPVGEKESIGQYVMLAGRFAVKAFAKLQSLAPSRSYSAVQAHNMPDFLVFSAFAQKFSGRPVVLDLHDLTVELFGSKWGERKSALLLPFVKIVERLSCGFASRVITTSSGFQDRLVARGVPKEKITLVLNTPDPDVYRFQEGREFRPIARGARLLYHGTVARRFGLATAIDALALLQQRVPESTLAIYGKYDADYRAELEARIAALGLAGKVSLGGWIGPNEIMDAMRAADFGVVPYLSDDFMNLALSTKTFEYAAAGLPVVASRLDSALRVFDDQCLGFARPGDAQDFADAISAACADPELRRERTIKARAAMEGISGQIMRERYVGLMRSLIGANGKS